MDRKLEILSLFEKKERELGSDLFDARETLFAQRQAVAKTEEKIWKLRNALDGVQRKIFYKFTEMSEMEKIAHGSNCSLEEVRKGLLLMKEKEPNLEKEEKAKEG